MHVSYGTYVTYVNLCHLLFLCHYIWFWLVQQYLKTDTGSADRHIVTLLQPVVESGLRTCAPSIDPPHIVTLLGWARQCNGGGERSKCYIACNAEYFILQNKCKSKLKAINGSLFGLYHKCLQLLIINIMRNIIVLLVGTENLRFPQKWQGVIFHPLLSVLGVIVIFNVWIMKKLTLDWTLQ